MYYVHVSYTTGKAAIRRSVAYIAHREERLPEPRSRELYGIGARYRALRGDERAAIRELTRDGAELRKPRYYKIKLTVDDRAAKRLARLDPARREMALRDAVERTFRGAFRGAQGVFVVHENEAGRRRPYGNPHVHVFLSPLTADGKTYHISRSRLATFKARWEREVGRVLERRERGHARAPGEHARFGERLALARSLGQLALGRGDAAAAALARALPGAPGRAAKIQKGLLEAATAPEQLTRRIAFNLLARFIPAPMRPTVEVVQALGPADPEGLRGLRACSGSGLVHY